MKTILMPVTSPPRDIFKLLLHLGAAFLFFIAMIFVLGFFPETGTGLDPAIAHGRCVFFPGTVTLDTASIDQNVGISIDESRIQSRVKPRSSFDGFSYDDMVIGITNYHNYPVLAEGMCTYADTRGRQVSSTPLPQYFIPAGKKMQYRIFLSLSSSDNFLKCPPLDLTFNPSSRNIGRISCEIRNVSQAAAPS